jgi:hypothetical protein
MIGELLYDKYTMDMAECDEGVAEEKHFGIRINYYTL